MEKINDWMNYFSRFIVLTEAYTLLSGIDGGS